MPYNLLSQPIRKYIRDKRWEQLRPIQSAAIRRIMNSNDNFILASRTASGKTEAAFLPILSKVDFREAGIQVLYISPLIALINDQFKRVEELCAYLDVRVTKWHGEANKSAKENSVKHPEGIMLITPESLEAMFVHKPENIRLLFSGLKYVVIDEIHAFIGTDRGIQLKSILNRLQEIKKSHFSMIGLSATIGDYTEAKSFTGDSEHTTVLLDKTAKEIKPLFRYFKNDALELPLELIKDLYLESINSKMLIFPNTRAQTEEIAVKLRKIAERVGGHAHYFSHHASVHKEVREFIESFAKQSEQKPFAIACTSTLELGIDIGSVDKVAQIDATNSVASLIQRVGRSGRKEGQQSNLLLYATNPWELLQSMACWELYKEGIIDPPDVLDKPYDLFVHQLLSIVKEKSGIQETVFRKQLKQNAAFTSITPSETDEIILHLLQNDLLERIGSEVILGIKGERIVNGKDFYTVFKSESGFKVTNGGNTIGEVPFSPLIMEGENIFLAASIWKITSVDMKGGKISVIQAKDGKRPIFYGNAAPVHSIIREKMLRILLEDDAPEYLDEAGTEELYKLRETFAVFHLNGSRERPLLLKESRCELYTFTGTKINRALACLLNMSGIKNGISETKSVIETEESAAYLRSVWKKLPELMPELDDSLTEMLRDRPGMIGFSKWGHLLPEKYQVMLLKKRYYDFDGAIEFVRSTQLKEPDDLLS
ncbi:MAG: DEAD/DEAH box helicase [Bacteroidales bacterium]